MILFYISGITNARIGLIKVIWAFLFQLFVRQARPSIGRAHAIDIELHVFNRTGRIRMIARCNRE